MPPPKIFRILIALWIDSELPTRAEPTGQPNPLLKQTLMVSKSFPWALGSSPFRTRAFHSRAPSKWYFRSRSRQSCPILGSSSRSQQAPPPLLVVFSIQTRLVRGLWTSKGLMAASTWETVIMPLSPWTNLQDTPLLKLAPPPSKL